MNTFRKTNFNISTWIYGDITIYHTTMFFLLNTTKVQTNGNKKDLYTEKINAKL